LSTLSTWIDGPIRPVVAIIVLPSLQSSHHGGINIVHYLYIYLDKLYTKSYFVCNDGLARVA